MKITANSVTNEEMTELYREPMLALEGRLQAVLGDNNYGGNVDSLAFMAISVFMDNVENEKFVSNFNKVGYFKSPLTGERMKYLSVAFAISPEDVPSKSGIELAQMFLAHLIAALRNGEFKIPKGFDVERLIVDVEREMDALNARGSIH
jgi:hypothetical protein